DAVLAGAAEVHAVVDLAVAVVVLAVALLGRGLLATLAGDGAVHAGVDAAAALALGVAAGRADDDGGIVRIGGAVDAVRRGAGLVDLAVAVVVGAVAHLGVGAGAAVADRDAVGVADERARLARQAHRRVRVLARVVVRRAVAAELDAVVDDAVAVVVE